MGNKPVKKKKSCNLATMHAGVVELFKNSGSRTFVEVGVDRGGLSKDICDLEQTKEVYMVDPWAAYAKYDMKWMSEAMAACVEWASWLPHAHIMRMGSVQAAKAFEKNSIDFVFLDGDHTYEGVKADIGAWLDIVKEDGILAGDNYEFTEVGQAVDELLPDNIQLPKATGRRVWVYDKQRRPVENLVPDRLKIPNA